MAITYCYWSNNKSRCWRYLGIKLFCGIGYEAWPDWNLINRFGFHQRLQKWAFNSKANRIQIYNKNKSGINLRWFVGVLLCCLFYYWAQRNAKRKEQRKKTKIKTMQNSKYFGYFIIWLRSMVFSWYFSLFACYTRPSKYFSSRHLYDFHVIRPSLLHIFFRNHHNNKLNDRLWLLFSELFHLFSHS